MVDWNVLCICRRNNSAPFNRQSITLKERGGLSNEHVQQCYIAFASYALLKDINKQVLR
ncbi:hypothetical protein KIN20_007235 [Parelaphostrongylus tenuis]|uniref:Uncharacterized protein n=1 Tax=Parelaphostrongylus tenuis TaxID=148309 RepID=A0AAD5MNU4_PARTN|nr:hypothetical protein KIN20_007235 [Parelaphostrongylus tenuis]